MPSSRLALLVLPALALGGCAVGDDGPRTSQARDVELFTRVDNQGSVDVRLRVGESLNVRVLAGEKVIDDVRTEVRDDTMRVTFDHSGFGGDNVVVEASVPELTGVVVDGSGNVEATTAIPP
jgi:Putative auto-transporter adhesin, head GIN domain